MGDFTVFRVVGIPASVDNSTLSELGLQDYAYEILRSEVRQLSGICKDAVHAFAPVRGGELRESVTENMSGIQSIISVPEITHATHELGGLDTRRRTKKAGARISNAFLARILDEGILRSSPPPSTDFIRRRPRISGGKLLTRSQNALPAGIFQNSPKQGELTALWVKDAQDAVEKVI